MDDSTLSNLENETLIENNSMNSKSIASSPSGRYWFIYYLTIRLLPLFLFFISLFILAYVPTFKILVITFSVLCEFWLTKNKEGLELVGLRWSHEISEKGADPKWVFYSRPDPYVPDNSQLHCFWTVMYTMTIIWSIISILSIITPDFLWVDAFLALIATASEYINLLCFLQCNQQTSKQQDEIARNVMLADAFDEPEPENEPEPEPEDDSLKAKIIHTEKTVEKKRRDLENPRLTLPLRTNKANNSNTTNTNDTLDNNNKSQNNDVINNDDGILLSDDQDNNTEKDDENIQSSKE